MTKERFLQATLWLFTLLVGMPLQAFADREVNQLQFGKQTITVASEDEITFFDHWVTAKIVDNNIYNSK